MTILDWFFIISLSLASIGLVFSGISFYLMTQTKKALKKVKRTKVSKKKRKQKKYKVRKLLQKSKKQRNWGTALIILFLLSGFTAGYSLYYQAMHLSQKDSKAVVQGYYLMDNLENELKTAKATENDVKSGKNIKLLAGQLSSYGIYKATIRNSEAGQKKLNKYYKSMKELGINLSSQPNDFFKNETLLNEFEMDLATVKKNHEEVVHYFNINKNALVNKK
ncbi:hypothetical protein UAW_02360 [Enterococcus haemoperoxidus ATCC BAA-382]|uniref:Uncharacterized protein n=1 Tax=Enterococcus haemoperoxidus ATCC BAA-382 TaxID=1158608 RepID=R2SP20_9ENTE|nr:hypothetical protein [Enterococcus haemoperoxidus]EOH94606.1 hypothetical protein UAW_02360 [Enterococcus haemoperoxidus ATCC BAA-382]EOT63248.1 hypothetical protein I583_00048 [Enterococcus haemoperoxidus ATCC BAA-382]OJG54085.1 hypothetical protein RV06_GL000478 [Enterococcus haemoperoxidus]